MPVVSINYDINTGSNTAASGAGPETALSGTDAYTGDGVGGGNNAIATLDGSPDLSSVATDGSHLLWIDTPSGSRKLFPIVGKDDGTDTVTVSQTISAIASASGVNWGIGGFRADMNYDSSNYDWEDMLSGWEFVFSPDTYTIETSITISALGDHTSGALQFRCSESGGTAKTVFDRTGNFDTITLNNSNTFLNIKDIKFTRSSGSSSHGAINMNLSTVSQIENVEIDGTGMDIGIDTNSTYIANIDNAKIYNCSSHGINTTGTTGGKSIIRRSSIFNNGGAGIYDDGNSRITNLYQENLIYGNGDSGIKISNTGSSGKITLISRNTIDKNTGSGIDVSDTTGADTTGLIIEENILSNNTAYGIAVAADQLEIVLSNKENHYYNNGSGDRNNLPAGNGDSSGDPLYTSVSDYTPADGSPVIDTGIQRTTD